MALVKVNCRLWAVKTTDVHKACTIRRADVVDYDHQATCITEHMTFKRGKENIKTIYTT
jgi:hypothetical protein